MSEAFYCQTQDLAIGYGKTPLLQNIGIGVQRGQILACLLYTSPSPRDS